MSVHENMLAQQAANMSADEQAAIVKVLSSDIMFAELKRRHDTMYKTLNRIADSFERGVEECELQK